MNLKKYIINLIFIALLGCFVLSANTSPPANIDPYTGLYYVYGSKIVSAGSFSDTTNISSVVVVKMMSEKTDTLHFFGLPGADEGEIKTYYGRHQIGDKVSGVSGYDDYVRDRVYGSHKGGSFEIDYNIIDFYNATGSITEDKIEIQGHFTGRSLSVEYHLVGERIVNYH